MKPEPKKVTRADMRLMEHRAKIILRRPESGWVETMLARGVLHLATQIDNYWAEIFPVFELIDREIRENNCTLTYGPNGYELRTPTGVLLSEGEDFRQWLIDHATFHLQPSDTTLHVDADSLV